MSTQLFVLFGDVVKSRKIFGRISFQNKLDEAIEKINTKYENDFYAKIESIKGIDEIGAVLRNISNICDILEDFQDALFPDKIRFVTVFGKIDIDSATRETRYMDGPAFHIAAEMLTRLKRSDLLFDIYTDNMVFDNLIRGNINLILLLRSQWSDVERQYAMEYSNKNQTMIAEKYNVSQQAISEALKRANVKELRIVESDLKDSLRAYDFLLLHSNHSNHDKD